MSQVRDSQRSKVYAAETTMNWGDKPPDFETLAQTQAYVDSVLASSFVQSRWGRRTVRVERGRGYSGVSYGGLITLGRDAQRVWTVLHELAHELAPQSTKHGPEFAAVYLLLVGRFMGADVARDLRAAFVKIKVRHRWAGMPKPGTHTVITQSERKAAVRKKVTRPVSGGEARMAASILRRAIANDVFGPPGRKPRIHAQQTARTLEARHRDG